MRLRFWVESFGHRVVRFWGWGRVGIEGFRAQAHNRLRFPTHPSGPGAPLDVLREALAHGGFSKSVTMRYHGVYSDHEYKDWNVKGCFTCLGASTISGRDIFNAKMYNLYYRAPRIVGNLISSTNPYHQDLYISIEHL